jgi:hypothetical protein
VVFNAVKTHFRQVEATAGVAGAQVWALSVIQHEPGIGVGGCPAAGFFQLSSLGKRPPAAFAGRPP